MAYDLLAGVRLLDLSQYLPGPYATQLLADLGAEVVKVEPPAGDPMRRIGPADPDGTSAFYKLVNAGKTVVRLDLKTEDGRAALAGLLGRADALLESYRPGTLGRLGFDAAALEAINRGLVHCALSGFGQDGPLAGAAGHDVTYMALGGGLAASGPTDRPVMAHPPAADYASAIQAALAVVAGLLRRARDGRGAFLDVSLMETVLGWQASTLTAAARGAPPARESALLNGGAACYRIYWTADGRFLALGALEAHFWRAFCEAVGRPAWTGRQWEALPQHGLIAEVAEVIAGRSLAEWDTALAGVDCCAEPVLEPAEVPEHPHVAARGLVRRGGDARAPLVEVLLPTLLDRAGPAERAPLRQTDAAEVLAAWTDSGAEP